jgi:hypothetical protein
MTARYHCATHDQDFDSDESFKFHLYAWHPIGAPIQGEQLGLDSHGLPTGERDLPSGSDQPTLGSEVRDRTASPDRGMDGDRLAVRPSGQEVPR